MNKSKNEIIFDLGFWSILAAIMLFGISQKANAWDYYEGYEGVWFPEGSTVTFDFYNVICREDQSLKMEETIRYAVDTLNLLDQGDRVYVYGGRRDTSAYGNWEQNHTLDVLLTLECNTNGQMTGTYGKGLPVAVDGDLVDGGMQINQKMPNHDVLQVVTLHEISHVLAISHSTKYDSLMNLATRNDEDTPFKVVWRQDTLCALKHRLGEDMLWPVTHVSATSTARLFLSRISWLGLNFETWLIPKDDAFIASDVKQINSCEDLAD